MTNYTLESLAQYAQPVKSHYEPKQSFAEKFPAEHQWIQNSSFEFASKMKQVLQQFGGLTPGQLAAVQQCVRIEAERSRAPYAPGSIDPTGLDLTALPAGMYAVPDGNTRLKVKVSKPAGKWAGWIFVTDGAEYGRAERYGAQRPGGLYDGKIREQMALIAHDPAAASSAYGRLVGRCGVCGRPLEDEASVSRGIGPVCAARMGW